MFNQALPVNELRRNDVQLKYEGLVPNTISAYFFTG